MRTRDLLETKVQSSILSPKSVDPIYERCLPAGQQDLICFRWFLCGRRAFWLLWRFLLFQFVYLRIAAFLFLSFLWARSL